MPPKIVYGKKKTATQTEINFSKFISPKKDGAATQRAGGGAVAVEDDWRRQLEIAADDKAGEDVLEALEKGFEALGLEQPQPRNAVKTTKKHKSRKTEEASNGVEAQENLIPEEDTSNQKAETGVSERASDPLQDTSVLPSRRKKRREPLNDHDVRSSGNGKVAVLEARSVKKKGRQESKESCSSPTRVRQPTSRPGSSTFPSKLPLPTPESTPGPDCHYSTYASPLLSMTATGRIQPFDHWSAELEKLFDITKIAEASFSEVYRLSAHGSTGSSNEESVLKLVALKTPTDIPLMSQQNPRQVRDREGQIAKEKAEREEKDMWKSEVDDVVSEAKLLHNLAHIPGFTNFRDLTVLQGRPTPFFAKAWKAWNKTKARGQKSEFPDPSKKSSYEETQLWAVIEMQDAGTDCEKLMETGGLSSIWEVWDVFWGVCLSVAKAEEACRFEHRDLHMGNICVRSSRGDGGTMDITVQDPTHGKFRFTGLETTVIDYTLSRADILEPSSRRSSSISARTISSSSSTSDSADVAYLDLGKDPELFKGDASEEYQYEIYRYMRGAALYNNPLQNSTPEPTHEPRRSPRKNTHMRFNSSGSITATRPQENVWAKFHPKTNLVWAHFLLHKLLTHLDASCNVPGKLSVKQIMANVGDQEADAKRVQKKAMKLHGALKKVSELLCPVALGREESLGSVKDLVLLAIDERWLRTGDVIG